jgi:ABC-2 type transport system permease protein
MLAIAMRELRSLFLTPLAWVLLSVAEFLLAYVFLRLLQAFGQTQGQLQALPGAPGVTRLVAMPLFETCAFILMLLVPILTMRALAQERHTQTLTLLLSAPVSAMDIVLGKYLGVLGFVLIVVALAVLMPVTLYAGTTLDHGQLLAGILGLVLVAGTFVAVGMLASALSTQPAMAAALAFAILALLWMLDWGAERSGLFSYLSVLTHLRVLLRGIVDTQDIMYFLILSGGCVYFSARRIETLRSPL